MEIIEKISSFAGKTFTLWVLFFAVIAYSFPGHFVWLGGYIVPLLGIVMFGMGLTLELSDFREVFDVSVSSLFLSIVQVVIVPLAVGFLIKKLFGKQAQAGAKALPLVSVIAIVLIVSAVVAGSAAKIAETGLLIFGVVILHNLLGFLIGFFFARLCGMDLAKQKAVAMEVGMQNSGLGVAIASAHFSPLAAVPSAIFSVWHNLSGSVLANIFSRMKDKHPSDKHDIAV
ncbi:bile acid:sodium symporter family protein [Neobacillus drentensis]|uniref:bile acid:sodium symporter family protein n=1 Tax=Neobacillus drentensis TaxID=220684 RepID=UPI003000CD54